MSELGNLGVYCLLGCDAIDHMGGSQIQNIQFNWISLTLKTVVGCLKLKGLLLLLPLV